jgi:AraC-like ligand binding domain
MNPDELHTGRAETAGGWRYRMLYIDRKTLQGVTGERAWWFKDAVIGDAQSGLCLGALLRQLWAADEPLAFDSVLHTLLCQLRVHARVARPTPLAAALRFAPVLDHMRARLHHPLRMADQAHLNRSFARRCGTTPGAGTLGVCHLTPHCLNKHTKHWRGRTPAP